MLNRKYYEGYEGEGAVKVWYNEDDIEDGLIIWIGYFNTILEGCFYPEFKKNGLIECYYNQNGFFDDTWEILYPSIVLEELQRFDEQKLDTNDENIIKVTKEIIVQLEKCINSKEKKEGKLYVEYV